MGVGIQPRMITQTWRTPVAHPKWTHNNGSDDVPPSGIISYSPFFRGISPQREASAHAVRGTSAPVAVHGLTRVSSAGCRTGRARAPPSEAPDVRHPHCVRVLLDCPAHAHAPCPVPCAPSALGIRVCSRANVDLQQDFSLSQTLSLYLLDTMPKLDPNADDFVLQVRSRCVSGNESLEGKRWVG